MIKQLKNRKGFTLVEIIAVVVIIGLLAGIAIPLVTKYVQDGRNEYNKKLEEEFLTIVKDYYAENPELVPKGRDAKGFSSAVFLTNLQANNYLSEELKDANGGSCYDSVGYALFENGKTNYYACLVCENYTGTMNNPQECSSFGSYAECANRENKELRLINGIDYGEYDHTWTNENVTLKVTLEEATSIILRINKYVFKPDEVHGNVYTFVINKNVNGFVSIHDRCGNSYVETNENNIILIDKAAPEVELTGKKSFVIKYDEDEVSVNHNIKIKDFSNVNNFHEYCIGSSCNELDKNNDKDYSISHVITSSGNYNFKIISTDEANNKTTKKRDFIVKNQIKFDLVGGKGDKDFKEIVDKKKDEKITLPSVSKTGYILNGWLDKKTGNGVDGSQYVENKSTTLQAKWTAKTVEVKFVCPDKTYTRKYTYGVTGQQFTDLCYKVGHSQIGWAVKSGATDRDYTTDSGVADWWIDQKSPSISLYPVWQKLSTTVHFVCPNGEQVRTYTYGAQNQAFNVSCSTTGYNQVGWSYSQNGPYAHSTDSGVVDSWIISKAGHVWLYPVWTAKTVVVGFDCGVNSTDKNVYYQTFTYGASGQQFAFSCSVPGYRQTSWYSNEDNYTYEVNSGVADSWINVKSPSIWLYPNWEVIPVPPTPSVTVRFHCLDENYNYTDDRVYSYTYYKGTANQYFLGGCNPVYGFDNVGWSLEQYGSTIWNLGIAVQDYWIEENNGQTIDVYASWAAKTVEVNFVCSTNDIKKQTFTYGVSGQQFNSNCAGNGLVQRGWSYSENGNLDYSLNNGVSDGWIVNNSPSVTLYPVWSYPQIISDSCPHDKVPPVCVLEKSCYSVGGGVSAGFKCTDATSSFDIYSVFAEQGWQSERFSSVANIKAALNHKNSGTAGTWISPKNNGTTTWTTSTTPWNPPKKGKTYTFYFGAIDACGNAVVYDNVTNSCKYSYD